MYHMAPRFPLAPTLSRKRERGRAERFINAGALPRPLGEPLLPLAGEGGPKGRMRVSRSASRRRVQRSR